MSNSSQPPNYSTTLSSEDTITIVGADSQYDYSNASTITLTSTPTSYTYNTGMYSSGQTITVSGIDLSGIDSIATWAAESTEFVNCFPDWSKVEEMRGKYPALEIAFKKFQEVYKMVEDDYDAQKGGKYVP